MFTKPVIKDLADLKAAIQLAKDNQLEVLIIDGIEIRPSATVVYIPNKPTMTDVSSQLFYQHTPIPSDADSDPLEHELFRS